MNSIMIRFKVIDFDRWKAAFDANESWRRTSGEQNYRVFSDTDDPLMITVLLGWDSPDYGQSFINSPQLRRKMQDGGVVGEPTFFLLKDL